MVPITDVMFLASKPRKIFFFLIEYIIDLIYYKIKLFLARPKPLTSTVKSRINSDNGTISRSRPGAGIPARIATAPASTGK
jgi:hypothetical protein